MAAEVEKQKNIDDMAQSRGYVLHLRVNGQAVDTGSDPNVTLLSVIRDQLHLRGTRSRAGAVSAVRARSCLTDSP